MLQCVHPQNDEMLKKMWEQAGDKYDMSKLVYRFYRTNSHHETCTCVECDAKKYFNSAECIDFLNQFSFDIGNAITNPETGEEISIKDELHENGSLFSTKYTAGCFLGTHTDKYMGKVAFVFNLTKDWSEEYGGILHHTNKQTGQMDTIYPEFNSLVMFTIPVQTGVSHYVSRIKDDLDSTLGRYAISGWFK